MFAFYFWMIVCGGLGSLMRYGVTQGVVTLYGASWLGTLLVNIVGCFLFGFCYAWCARGTVSPCMRAVIVGGFLGGFTTMSAFAGDVFVAMSQHRFFDGAVYALVTNVGAIMAVWMGFITFNTFLK
ncbi:MAG: CrcB family protein [Candidatus Babeliales bacterium]|jgi:CrcB protein